MRASGTSGARVTVRVPAPLAGQGRYLVSVLDSIGYRASLRTMDPDAYFKTVGDARTRAQAGSYTWLPLYPSAADFIPPQFSCPASSNLSAFCDPAVDLQMALASSVQVQDPAAATVLWQQVEQALLAQAPVVPAYNRSDVDFVSNRLGNYQYNPQWGFLLDQAWVR